MLPSSSLLRLTRHSMPSLATVLPKRQVYTLVALGAVLLLLGTGTYHQRDLLPGAPLARKARRPGTSKCLDYNSPGYIFRGANHEPKEIR